MREDLLGPSEVIEPPFFTAHIDDAHLITPLIVGMATHSDVVFERTETFFRNIYDIYIPDKPLDEIPHATLAPLLASIKFSKPEFVFFKVDKLLSIEAYQAYAMKNPGPDLDNEEEE